MSGQQSPSNSTPSISGAGPSSSREETITLKRKRFVMLDDEEEQARPAIGKKLTERMQVASNFASNNEIGTSTWLMKRGTKVQSADVTIGSVILMPADLADANEVMDDNWAMTSNWYYCQIESIEARATTALKLLGALFPIEGDTLEVGATAKILLPQWILIPTGKLAAKGLELLAATEHKENEGEELVKEPLVKKVSLNGIPDLDYINRSCSLKN